MKKISFGLLLILISVFIFSYNTEKVLASDEFQIVEGVLVAYNGISEEVFIPEGVVEIGEGAFSNNESVRKITIPNTVVKIGQEAFINCISLTDMYMKHSVVSIGDSAFENCSSIVDFTLPQSVSSLGNDVFSNCTSIETLFLSENIVMAGTNIFTGCDSLTIQCLENSYISSYAQIYGIDHSFVSYGNMGDFLTDGNVLIKYIGTDTDVTVPNGITAIGAYAFSGCGFIETISFEEEIDWLGAYAFFGCSGLITIPALNDIQMIGSNAFAGCMNLTSIEMLGEYSIIPEYAFLECSSLSSIVLNQSYNYIGEKAFKKCTAIKSFDFPSGLAAIGDNAFLDCFSLVSVNLPDSVARMGVGVFSNCARLTTAGLSKNSLSTGNFTFSGCDKLDSVEIPEGVTAIGSSCFAGCSSLKSVDIPSTIRTIGDKSFLDSGLKSIDLPEDLETINEEAFVNSISNVAITIPRSVTHIGNDAFKNCENIIIKCYYNSYAYEYSNTHGLQYDLIGDAENPFVVENGVLLGYFGTEADVVIPREVSEIGENAFLGKSYIYTVTIPDSISVIGNRAFSECGNLESIAIPKSVLSVGDEAFKDCYNLRSIRIERETNIIGIDVFDGCTDLTVDCFFGSAIDEYANEKGIKRFYLPDEMPIEEIVIEETPDRLLCDNNGIIITAQAYKHEQSATNTEFRISYRKTDDSWWSYASPYFANSNENGKMVYEFMPIEEGEYVFRIEAKTEGGAETDITQMTDSVGLYFGAFPANEITSLRTGKESYQFSEEIELEFESNPSAEYPELEYQIMYSTNNSYWKIAPDNYIWKSTAVDENGFGRILFNLPANLLDSKYYIRLNIRTMGRTKTDREETCEVTMYNTMPLKAVDLEDISEVQVLPAEGVLLRAKAASEEGYSLEAQYRFYYARGDSDIFRAFTGWTTSDEARFRTRYEGEYRFMVEAKSLGRRSVDASDISDNSTFVYIGAVPSHSLEVTTEKADYEYGEAVELRISLVPGAENQQTQYLIQYSTNGRGYMNVPGETWEEYTGEDVELGGAIFEEVYLPSYTREAKYYIKILTRTIGRRGYDGSAVCELNMSVGESLSEVELLDIDMPCIQNAEGIGVEAVASMEDGSKAHAEYRFAYRAENSTRWTYVSSKFGFSGKTNIRLRAEGRYQFKVEAKTAGRIIVDDYDESEIVEVFIGALPAKDISIALVDEKTEYLVDEKVSLDVSATPSEDERYQALEYQLMYSTNGRSFRVLRGYDYGEYDGVESITFPNSTRDIKYYVKVNVRTQNRTLADATSNIVIVNRFIVLPVDDVEISYSGENPTVVPQEGIVLSAHATRQGLDVDAEYRFMYRVEGSLRWSYISSGFSKNPTVEFIPRTEGKYLFRVQARTKGRRTIDTYSDLDESVDLYFDKLPARQVFASPGDKTEFMYVESIPIEILATGNGTEQNEMEYQIMYSTNNRSWRVTAEYKEWKDLSLIDGSTNIDFIMPQSNRDYHYYIKVNLRSKGRGTIDASDVFEVDMRYRMPMQNVSIYYMENNPTVVPEQGIEISAKALAKEGYEKLTEPEYRFLYRLSGTTRWMYISSRFSTEERILFKPRAEGEYEFKVQARSKGRRTIDISEVMDEPIGLYFIKLPAKEVNVSRGEKSEYLYSEEISLEIDALGNGTAEDELEYQIMYSTNNVSWRYTSDFRLWKDLIIEDGKALVDYKIPMLSRDYHYYIKVNIRSKGRKTVDAYNTCEVDMYYIMPLQQVFIDTVEQNENSEIRISAHAEYKEGYGGENFNPLYRFFYRKSGTLKWIALTGYISESSYAFSPPEGTYDFKVVTRNKGRIVDDCFDEAFGFEYSLISPEGIEEENPIPSPSPTPIQSPMPSGSPEPAPVPSENATSSEAPEPAPSAEPGPSPSTELIPSAVPISTPIANG